MHRRKFLGLVAVTLSAALVAGACGKDSDKKDASSGSSTTASAPVKLRLGYLANLTHATALIGVDKGIFAKHLKGGFESKTFNAGGDAVTALFSDAIDAAYVGPNPAINGWAKSNGQALKIIAGATSGGAALVVKPSITKAADLKGKTLATPQVGNTQDVALRWWLKGFNLTAPAEGGGDVKINAQDNGLTLQAFQTGTIDGAWVPEPWASRLVLDGGGHVLVNERDLWDTGDFVTTHLIVSQKFLKAHPDVVKQLLAADVEANDYINKNSDAARADANTALEKLTGKTLSDAVITAAWKNLRFTPDPIAASLKLSAKHAQDVGLLQPVDLTGIYDLKLLNEVLKAAGDDPVKAA